MVIKIINKTIAIHSPSLWESVNINIRHIKSATWRCPEITFLSIKWLFVKLIQGPTNYTF